MVEPPAPVVRQGSCESCGSVEEVAHVRRFYVTPPAWDTEGGVQAGDEEWWCFVCRTHYPHQPLDERGEPIGDGPAD